MPAAWRRSVPAGILLVLLACPSGTRADGPAATAEQREQLREADRLTERVVRLNEEGKFAEALPLARKVKEIRGQVLGKHAPEYLQALNNLAELHRAMGQYGQAEALLREVMQVFQQPAAEAGGAALARRPEGDRTVSPADERYRPYYVQTLAALAKVSQAMGKYAQAERSYRAVLEINQKEVGPKPFNFAKELQGLLGPAQASVVKFAQYAHALNNLAQMYQQMGDFRQAEQLFREALEVIEGLIAECHRQGGRAWQEMGKRSFLRGVCLQNLANLYEQTGDYEKAEPLYREALQTIKQGLDPKYAYGALGPKHPYYAITLTNLAYLYQAMGDYGRAGSLYREALQVRKQGLGEKHPEYAQGLNNLASVLVLRRDFAQAEPLLRQALEIRKETLGESHPLYSNSVNNLAALYQWKGDFKKAEPLFQEVLDIRKQVPGEKHPDYAGALTNLGKLYQAMGEPKRAEPLHRQALEILRPALGERHPSYATVLQNLAICSLIAGEPAAGEPLAFQAAEITRQHLERVAAVQSQAQQLVSAQKDFSQIEVLLNTTAGTQTPAAKVYDEVLLWKGAVAGNQVAIRRFRARLKETGDRKLLDIYYDLQGATRQLDRLLSRRAEPQQVTEHQKELRELGERIEAMEKELASGSAEFRRQRDERRRTSADLARALPANAAFIDLLQYNRFLPPAQRKDPKLEWETRLVGFVVRPKQPVVRVELGPAEAIGKEVARWRQAGNEAGAALRRLVWEPLAGHLKDVTAVLISPDGALTRFSFAALPGKRPGSYLIEDMAVAVVPVPQQLPELLAPVGNIVDPSLLLVGAVNYGIPEPDGTGPASGGAALREDRLTWTDLPATGPEVQAIRGQFERLYPQAAVTELTGHAATEEAVRRLAQERRYLHFATHGFYDPPGRRSVLAAVSQPSGPAGAGSAVTGWYPGLLSGLVLAGANRLTTRDQDNGILTSLEWEPLDLGSVELAVLSACQTAQGEYVAGGEGLLGLQRAFQTAGARSVVASLWQVDDAATRRLMARFYYNLWQRKLGRLEALRQAQLSLLYEGVGAASRPRGLEAVPEVAVGQATARLDPRLWAAWVLSGAPGDLAGVAPVQKWVSSYPPDLEDGPRPAVTSRGWLLPLLGATVLCVLGLLLVRKFRPR